MPQFTGSVFLPDGSLLASGVPGEFVLDDSDGGMGYSGRFTIRADRSSLLSQDPEPLLLRVDGGPAIHFRMTRMQTGARRPKATVYFVSHDKSLDDRPA